jgi:hypothetical protein
MNPEKIIISLHSESQLTTSLKMSGARQKITVLEITTTDTHKQTLGFFFFYEEQGFPTDDVNAITAICWQII